MKKALFIVPVVLLAVLTVGCVSVYSPVGQGAAFMKVRGPVDAGSAQLADGATMKTGSSTCMCIAGMVALGDASIEAAMKQGGLTKIHHVDYEVYSIASVYARYKTIVYGE